MRYLFQIIAAFVLYLIGKFFVPEKLGSHFVAECVIILVTLLIVDGSYDVYKNRNRLILVIKCWLLRIQGQYIRFSMSYQYRIRVNDKYLLVKNSNWNFYQNVGGKYKRLPFTEKILRDFEARDDIKLPTIGLMKDDLAIFIPAKNAIKFIDWFNTRKEREISHWREFYEELIEGKGSVLSQRNFPYVNYNYVTSVITPLKRAEAAGWDCYEILQYDVLDLLPTDKQEQELKELLDKGDNDYVKWADEELIQSLGYNKHTRKCEYSIANHSKWVLNLRWTKK